MQKYRKTCFFRAIFAFQFEKLTHGEFPLGRGWCVLERFLQTDLRESASWKASVEATSDSTPRRALWALAKPPSFSLFKRVEASGQKRKCPLEGPAKKSLAGVKYRSPEVYRHSVDILSQRVVRPIQVLLDLDAQRIPGVCIRFKPPSPALCRHNVSHTVDCEVVVVDLRTLAIGIVVMHLPDDVVPETTRQIARNRVVSGRVYRRSPGRSRTVLRIELQVSKSPLPLS